MAIVILNDYLLLVAINVEPPADILIFRLQVWVGIYSLIGTVSLIKDVFT